jgi:hypothetical protein
MISCLQKKPKADGADKAEYICSWQFANSIAIAMARSVLFMVLSILPMSFCAVSGQLGLLRHIDRVNG